MTSSVSEIGTVIIDQTNSGFEDEANAWNVVDEIHTQITDPLSNALDALLAQDDAYDIAP